MAKRLSVLIYGVVMYVMCLGVLLYTAGFVGNFLVPRSIDSPAQGTAGPALLIDALLLALFGIQHSVMARPGFKRWWTRLVPEPIERSTYMLFANLALILLFWQWRPLGGVVWDVANPAARFALYGLDAAGWLIVLWTTFLINHFDLFGLRQTWLFFRGRDYRALGFVTPGPYGWIRHPLYIGWLTTFWAAPTMTAAHLVFALGMTAYILIAIDFEERDLLQFHGAAYRRYRSEVPMLVPRFGRRSLPAAQALRREADPLEQPPASLSNPSAGS